MRWLSKSCVRLSTYIKMGSGGSTLRETLQSATAEEVALLAEARRRPAIVAAAIREHELDGATVLVLGDDDICARRRRFFLAT